jgi:hypothetical protein
MILRNSSFMVTLALHPPDDANDSMLVFLLQARIPNQNQGRAAGPTRKRIGQRGINKSANFTIIGSGGSVQSRAAQRVPLRLALAEFHWFPLEPTNRPLRENAAKDGGSPPALAGYPPSCGWVISRFLAYS